jgi:predicted Fe-Mo cluster-binding NifX family protein
VTFTTDSRVLVGAFLNSRHLNFLGSGVSVAENVLTNAFDITIAAGIGATSSDTLSNKNINLTANTVTDTSTALGDLAKSNGSKFVRFPHGSAGTFLETNSAGTDLTWGRPFTRGETSATGNGSSVSFTITHGLGVNPGAVSVTATTSAASAVFFVVHSSTTITVTYSVAPTSAAPLGWSWVAFT